MVLQCWCLVSNKKSGGIRRVPQASICYMPSSNTFPTSNSHVMDQFLNKYSKHVITEPLSCHIVTIIIIFMQAYISCTYLWDITKLRYTNPKLHCVITQAIHTVQNIYRAIVANYHYFKFLTFTIDLGNDHVTLLFSWHKPFDFSTPVDKLC